MKGKDFIVTGLQSWDIPIGSNAIDIAKEIAKENRVLYVNSPLDIMTIYRKKKAAETEYRMDVIKGKRMPLRQIEENLWVLDFPFFIWSVNGLPDGVLFDMVNKHNNRKIFNYINKIAEQLGFADVIHFIDNDIYRSFYAKEMLKAKLSVYYRRDNLHPFNYWKKHIGRLEPILINKSDLVVCNSPQLADYSHSFNKKSFNVGQGVDLTAYDSDSPLCEPKELQSVRRPRIGYIGDINSMRLDADLIFGLAKSKPQYSFVMIGNEDSKFKSHDLHKLKNVHFLGSILKKRVPEYMAAMDVCLNPQLLNEITIGNYPRKVDEYLAMGKPVIATHTKAMELFKDCTYLCSSLEDYQSALAIAINENNQDQISRRKQFARSHSWQNNVQLIYKHISKSLN